MILAILFSSLMSFASPKSICGLKDERVLSDVAQIGRVSLEGKNYGCTITMISSSCAITAGHCLDVMEVAQFNTPESINKIPQAAKKEDQYKVIKSSIKHQDLGPGTDWMVFKLAANEFTGKKAGDVQGHFSFSKISPTKLQKITITGYGSDSDDSKGHFSQQTHDGYVLGFPEGIINTALAHSVDTMGGNSGSTIRDYHTGDILGIHTHGGCHSTGGANEGTLIYKSPELVNAIIACLRSDK
jgi:V8-like Glu-specific endopeptidase